MKPFVPWRDCRVRAALLAVIFAGATFFSFAQPDDDHSLISRRHLVPIFNGTNLDGWIIRGGQASYVVADGVIVGACTMKGGGNTFLCTEKEYGDFILELEIKADKELNSGVQIRSHCFDAETTYDFGNRLIKVPAKRVHGYQVEVDHRPERRWSGGIYEEARRDWLFPLATNSAAGQAFKFGEWNKYRIQCVGSSIKTWINDVPAANLVDAETLRGFIGLQVHATDKPGIQVRFRNIRLQDLGEQQWVAAWDCRSLDGLEQGGAAEWKLEDGVLQATQVAPVSKMGTLTGNTPLMDFTVRFKYKIIKTGFSLVFLPQPGSKEQPGYSFPFVEPLVARVGATSITHLQDWNTVVASVRPTRAVVILNGHQYQDTAIPHTSGVFPGLRLPMGPDVEVYFKDFEILAPQQ